MKGKNLLRLLGLLILGAMAMGLAGCGQIAKQQNINNINNPLLSIVVSPVNVSLLKGAKQQFSAIGKNINNETLSVNPIWEVSNSIGTIDATGLFTALSVGTCKVFAKVGNISGEASVSITDLPDITPPKIIAVIPNSNAIDAEITDAISFTFNEDIKDSSVIFSLSSNDGYIIGNITYEPISRSVIFIPSQNLINDTTYVATISAHVKDLAGNEMGSDYSWSFTTKPGPVLEWDRNTYLSKSEIYLGGKYLNIDNNGNVYIVGRELTSGIGRPCLAKYDDLGNRLWKITYISGINDIKDCNAVALDSSGNICIVGTETGGDEDIWIRKHGNDGNVIWTNTFNGAANNIDRGENCAIDLDNNIYVVGYETLSDLKTQVWIRKYDTNGNVIWTRSYNNIGNPSFGRSITIDKNKNIYVIGREYIGSLSQIWIRKYDKDGNVIWTKNAGLCDGCGNDIKVDDYGNVYCIGFIYGRTLAWLSKYNNAGDVIWTRTYANINNQGSAIYLDKDNNINVIGIETRKDMINYLWLVKYSDQGLPLATKTYTALGEMQGKGIVIDSNFNIYVAAEKNDEIWLLKIKN